MKADYLLGRADEPRASGTTIVQLFHHAEGMSQEDLESLASFAETLTAKNQKAES